MFPSYPGAYADAGGREDRGGGRDRHRVHDVQRRATHARGERLVVREGECEGTRLNSVFKVGSAARGAR
jgi:hypothetical protein